MELRVLGPIEARRGNEELDLGTPKQRAVLAALALSPGLVVPVDRLADLVWGDAPPRAVAPSVQAYVSQLRRALEPHRRDPASYSVLTTRAGGYVLRVPDCEVDAHRFDAEVTALHRSLRLVPDTGPSPLSTGDLERAERDLARLLALWRGAPYADLGDAPDAAVERHRLEDLRALACEDQAAVWLALGDHARAAVHLEALTAAHPLRERLWALRAIALARGGRQADALGVLSTVRTVLVEELGLEPTPELQRLQGAVLRQDDSLGWRPPRDEAALGGGRPAAPDGPAYGRDPDSWATFGREGEAEQLDSALDRAARGRTTFAVVTGEAGSGRTRVVTDLAERARDSGFRAVWGSCSQDEEAPPLLPWRDVLTELGRSLPASTEARTGREGFACWQQVVDTLLEVARETPLLVVLDDLHWADTPTLRVLRRLVETAGPGRLLVTMTWRRPHVRPNEPLADLAANLGRQHAVRVELGGMSFESAIALFSAVSGRPTSHEEARVLREHTGGNPYLITEYAHAARRSSASVAELVAATPANVVELVTRRLALLPADAAEVLRVGASLGGDLDVAALAAATGTHPAEVVEMLEPARVAGFVAEVGVDRFAFGSAVVRDALARQVPASLAARLRSAAAAQA